MKRKEFTACLPNGDVVIEGSLVQSDTEGEGLKVGLIKRGCNGKLYFWEEGTNFSDYTNILKLK